MKKKRHIHFFFFYLLVWMLSAHPLCAQSSSTIRGIETGMRQEFNSYSWYGNADYQHQINPKLYFSIQENFKTSLLKLSSENDRWKDDQNLNIGLNYRLLDDLMLTSRIKSIVFLDKQSGFNNDIRSHMGMMGGSYRPSGQFSTQFAIGPKFETRYNQNDKGVTFNFDLGIRNLEVAEYDNSLSFVLNQDRYKERKNNLITARYIVSRRFSEQAADSMVFYYNNRRNDNYVSLLGDIESQREDSKGVKNHLKYNLGRINVSLNTQYEDKNVDLQQFQENIDIKRRKRNDQRLSNDLLFSFSSAVDGYVQISHWLQEQRYDLDFTDTGTPFSLRTAFVTPNNSSSKVNVISRLAKRITQKDSLSTYFAISKFQYDTPDTSNFDDRDELRMNSRFIAHHRFNDALELEVLTSVNLYHMVYIFGERSADNNWNRIFLLRPIVRYQPDKSLSVSQAFEVLANYVDYDFEDFSQYTKSFVFRKFSMSDSLQYSLTSRTAVLLDYRLQLEENGQLSWDDWSEKVLVTRSKQWMHIYLKYKTAKTSLMPGYSLFKRVEWRHQTDVYGIETREKYGSFTSHGPILKFDYRSTDRLLFSLDAMRYRVESNSQKPYYINNIEVRLRWLF